MKRIIIVGATSGIGYELAQLYIRKGWKTGVAGRNEKILSGLVNQAPGQVEAETIDITHTDAPDKLSILIERLGGMDIYLHCSGIGSQNESLTPGIELDTLRTNGEGFTRMLIAAYHYFRDNGGGHIAAISSIAGTKGIGVAPAYSATKRFQNTYIQSLVQLSRMENIPVRFTDIRPGFVDTPLLKDQHFPMLMKPEKVAGSIYKAIEKKKRVMVIDGRYRILVYLWNMIPNGIWEKLTFIR